MSVSPMKAPSEWGPLEEHSWQTVSESSGTVAYMASLPVLKLGSLLRATLQLPVKIHDTSKMNFMRYLDIVNACPMSIRKAKPPWIQQIFSSSRRYQLRLMTEFTTKLILKFAYSTYHTLLRPVGTSPP